MTLPATFRSAVYAAALLSVSGIVNATSITIDLADCEMGAQNLTECAGAAIPDHDPIRDGDPLWIDFQLDGEEDAHFVTETDAVWLIDIDLVYLPPSAPPDDGFPVTVSLTDMSGPIPGFELLDAAFISGDIIVPAVLIPGETFIHDIHVAAVPVVIGESVSFGGLRVETVDGGEAVPHQKGVWVSEPSTSTLLALGIISAGWARSRVHVEQSWPQGLDRTATRATVGGRLPNLLFRGPNPGTVPGLGDAGDRLYGTK